MESRMVLVEPQCMSGFGKLTIAARTFVRQI